MLVCMIEIKSLNNIILSKAQRLTYSVADAAPSTLGELQQGSLIVWSGASDHTIYQDASVNHAFRAWHDSWHKRLDAPFNAHGELLVAQAQCLEVNSSVVSEFIMVEIMGQLEYYQQHGSFPVNQQAFFEAYMRGVK